MSLKVQFATISVGPKAFCAISNSGWPEMYARVDCEKAVRAFLSPLDFHEVLTAFQLGQDAKRSEFPGRITLWGDVVSFLARIKSTKPTSIAGIVGVGFWGFSIVHEASSSGN